MDKGAWRAAVRGVTMEHVWAHTHTEGLDHDFQITFFYYKPLKIETTIFSMLRF